MGMKILILAFVVLLQGRGMRTETEYQSQVIREMFQEFFGPMNEEIVSIKDKYEALELNSEVLLNKMVDMLVASKLRDQVQQDLTYEVKSIKSDVKSMMDSCEDNNQVNEDIATINTETSSDDTVQEVCNTDLRWSKTSFDCLRGHNDRQLKTPTFEACKEKCVGETDFECRSVDYFPSEQTCQLSTTLSTSDDYEGPCRSPYEGNLFAEIIYDLQLRAVNFTAVAGEAGGTSSYLGQNRFIPANAFNGKSFWHSGESTLPQAVWFHFDQPIRVKIYSFESRDIADFKVNLTPDGPSKYEFYGSNAADCSDQSNWVVLKRDNSGTQFTPENKEKTESVNHPDFYTCYGFQIKEVPGRSNGENWVVIKNVNFWYY